MNLLSGATFLSPIKPGLKDHLWIILLDPDESDNTIIVNVTTENDTSDLTVRLIEGDHPFISRPSVIFYTGACISNIALIRSAIQTGIMRINEPVSEALLNRIRQGIIDSDYTKLGIQAYYRTRMNLHS